MSDILSLVREPPVRFASIDLGNGFVDLVAIGHDTDDKWCHFGSDGKLLTLEEVIEAEKVTEVVYE